jgi:hypothetical protein
MRELDKLPVRELQLLSARALSTMVANNDNIWQFNQQAHHNSHNWYKAVIRWYIDKYDGWPDEIGPGMNIKLIQDR